MCAVGRGSVSLSFSIDPGSHRNRGLIRTDPGSYGKEEMNKDVLDRRADESNTNISRIL